MTDDRHDDGLVHSHRWATEPSRPPAPPKPRVTSAPVEERDDGLVHSHGWACGQRGRPSH